MGIAYSPKVNRDTLVFYFDASNPKTISVNGQSTIQGIGGTLDSSYYNNSGKLIYDSTNLTVKRNAVNDGNDYYGTTSSITLGSNFTMQAFVKVTDLHNGTANGIITNHSHGGNTGAGINIKWISDTDFRISCNTGSGSSRTFQSYYGSTNIYNKWVLLTLRFVGNSFTLWVNDYIDYTGSYSQSNVNDRIQLFNWSTSYSSSTNYRPAFELSFASVYDRALSDTEIKQTFNTFKGRFL